MKQSSIRSPPRLQPTTHKHHNQQRAQNLHLPGLPRFHPANYQHALQSTDSSTVSSPASGLNSPQPPSSPRQQHRMYLDAQRHLYPMPREMPNRGFYLDSDFSGRPVAQRSPKPDSPRLHPLGSPGPVTPLELEEEHQQFGRRTGSPSLGGGGGGYFAVGAHHAKKSNFTGDEINEQLLNSYMQKEASAMAAAVKVATGVQPTSDPPSPLSARFYHQHQHHHHHHPSR